MKPSLKPGITYQHTFVVPVTKTVPALYPEAEEFQLMPEVFATGFLVGLLEWACLKAINPHLDWPAEQTVGTHIDVSHCAPTPPGMAVTADVELIAVNGKALTFAVRARDGSDLISEGRHERHVIVKERFDARVLAKRSDARQLDRDSVVKVTRLGWMGTRTPQFDQMNAFYRDVLGLHVLAIDDASGRFKLQDGTEVHVYGPNDPDHAFFADGPVVAFEVDDFHSAQSRLRAAGVEFVYPEPQRASGKTWRHFRAPDGNVYELIGADISP